MMIYRQNLAARGVPRPFVPIDDMDLDYAPEPEGKPPIRNLKLVDRFPPERPERPWDYTAPILAEVESWLLIHELPASRFGTLAIGDPKLIMDLRAGRDPSSRTVARIRAFMQREG